MKKTIIILSILLGVMIIGGVIAKNSGLIAKEEFTKVSIEVAKKQEVIGMVSASGKIYPEKEVKISPDVSGEIVDIFVEEGDSVRAGQTLFKIRPDDYETAISKSISTLNNTKAGVAQAEAGIAQAEAQVQQSKARMNQALAAYNNAQSEYERSQRLFEEQLISQKDLAAVKLQVSAAKNDYESTKSSVRSAESSLRSAKASKRASEYTVQSVQTDVRQAQTSFQKTIVRAPQSGIISRLNAQKGERVVGTSQMAGTEVMTISNLKNMECRVKVSEIDIARVEIGDTCDIEVDAYFDKKFKGVVTKISNSLGAGAAAQTVSTDQVTNFLVTVNILPESYTELRDRKFPFRPGMSASVDIITEKENNKVAVPIQAVTAKTEKAYLKLKKDSTASTANDKDLNEYVFLVKNGKTRLVPVKTGFQDSKYIVMENGVSLGDSIVVAPYNAITKTLKDEENVTVVKKSEVY